MNFLKIIYNEFLWKPLFNGLVWIYNFLPWPDLGLAIVIFTVIIRLLLTPLLLKARKAQKDMTIIQPEIKKIQEKHKNNKEEQGKALMELYAKYNINPFSGCLVMLVQLPILLALFQVFSQGVGVINPSYLYSFIKNPQTLYPISFGFLDLAKGSVYLGVLAALTQFFQTKMTMGPKKKGLGGGAKDMAEIIQWQALYLFPALILIWSYKLPSALTLYWTVLNILGILQEIILKEGKNQEPNQHGSGENQARNN